jgi:hypothetical protein
VVATPLAAGGRRDPDDRADVAGVPGLVDQHERRRP